MNRAVFVDTSAWYALADRGDTYHRPAAQWLRRIIDQGRGLVISNHVAAETYTILRVRLGAAVAHEFLQRSRASSSLQRVFCPESWEDAAEELLIRYADHDLSYVDATSFIAMHRLGLQEALAFDHHFTVLGFTLVGDEHN